jgi:ABC-2 type transport system permease protein
MLRALIEKLGVDYEQWRALVRLSLKIDLRTASMARSGYAQTSKSAKPSGQLFVQFLVYVVMGAMLSIFVVFSKDVFFTGMVLLTYTMMMTGMLVLIDFGAIVISPDDYAILGYQPVSSRTYFISRLTNILVYSTSLTLALSIIPVIAYFFTAGFRPLLGIAALLAALFTGLATTLFLVLIYATVLRVINPHRLRRIVGYFQLLLSFFIYGGYMVLPRLIKVETIAAMSIKKTPWLMLYPPAWFASYLDLAMGRMTAMEIAPALLSIVVLALLANHARGKLALEYSDRLSSATTVSERPKKSSGFVLPAIVFREGEARAVALLVRNQFKYDQKFRLAVLGILPLTVLYLYLGLDHGPLLDPFVNRGFGLDNSLLLYLAILMFPSLLRLSLTNSDSYQASWIYYATPADRSRLVLQAKNFIFVYFMIPYLLFIGAIFFYFYRNVWHVLAHLAVLALLSHAFLQLAALINPALPFSQPMRKAQRSTSFILIGMVTPFAAVALLGFLKMFVYPNPAVLMMTLAALIGLSWWGEKILQARVRRRTERFEYQD